MTIEQAVIEKLRALPVEKQREVLDFVEFLQRKSAPKPPLRSLKGLWADLKIDITQDDIAEARREMRGNLTAGSSKDGQCIGRDAPASIPEKPDARESRSGIYAEDAE